METFWTVLITIAAWHLLNFIVGSLVEKFERYGDTLETVIIWLNSFLIMAPLWVLVRIPLQFYRKLTLYTLYYFPDDREYSPCFLVRKIYSKKFDKKGYLAEGSTNLLKEWKSEGFFHSEKEYTYIKKNGYYLLIKK